MRFGSIMASFFLVLVAFVVAALGQTPGFDSITKPSKDEVVPAGSTYKVQWTTGDAKGTIKLSLVGGATPSQLEPLGDIATGLANTAGSYDWVVAASLGQLAVYGLQIVLESDTTIFQYSFPFQIKSQATRGASTSPPGTTSVPPAPNTISTLVTSGRSSSTASSASTGSSSDPAGTPSGLPTPGPTSDGGGLSKGAIAGIAVGSIVGVAILAALLFLVFHYRKKALNAHNSGMGHGKAELDGAGKAAPAEPLKVDELSELEEQVKPTEVQGSEPMPKDPVELDATPSPLAEKAPWTGAGVGAGVEAGDGDHKLEHLSKP